MVYHPGRAESALAAVQPGDALLHGRGTPPLADALDRGNVRSFWCRQEGGLAAAHKAISACNTTEGLDCRGRTVNKTKWGEARVHGPLDNVATCRFSRDGDGAGTATAGATADFCSA